MSGRFEQVTAGGTWDPHSLLGSWFRSETWPDPLEGCIVAEPSPGIYLAETGTGAQRLVPITDMTGWEFYDERGDAP